MGLFPSVTPKALVTTHPLMGLDWILDVWIKYIHTKLPWAELHIYSNIIQPLICSMKKDTETEIEIFMKHCLAD